MSGTGNNSGISPSERYQVGDLVVDVDARHVLRAGQKIHLTELSFDVLVALLRHAPNVVSRQQLMDEVWQKIIVEPDTVKKRITLLRESLDDNTHQEPLIRIVRGRGYTISAPVERFNSDDQRLSPIRANKMMGIPGIHSLVRDGTPETHNKDIDPLAFEAYLEGKMLLGEPPGRIAEGITALERAIDIDPGFAAAHAELSLCPMAQPTVEEQYLRFEEISRKLAQRALELDPQLPLAYLAAGRVALVLDLDLVSAEALFQKGLSFEPNNRYLLLYQGHLAMLRGDFDTAIEQAQSFAVDKPSFVNTHYNLGQNYYMAGRYREAINAYRRCLTLDPDGLFIHMAIGRVRVLQGDPETALKLMEQETSARFRPYGLAIAHAAGGDQAAADQAMKKFIAECGQKHPYWTGTLLAYSGKVDSAFDSFELAYSLRDTPLLEIKVDPLLKGIRNDPRYAELLHRMTLD